MTNREEDSFLRLVGIDVGGTFTDFVWRVNDTVYVLKVSTTPENQSKAIESGLDQLNVGLDVQVIHGTTVATNALLERRGANAGLVTTKGFADVLAIGRQNRPSLYAFSQEQRPLLMPAERRYELDERIDANGQVLKSIEDEEIERLVDQLKKDNVESLAIVFLFSFLNAEHERQVADRLATLLPGVNLSVSSDLLPEYREYERTSTLAINAYVQPLVAAYLNRLEERLMGRSIYVMQSNGGLLSLRNAAQQAGRLVLSGPAGGVVGAFEVAKRGLKTASPEIITFDMGGTSTDVALCPGHLPRTTEGEITGVPIRFPSMDIHTVGAGGGSIARVDAGGVLRVGPESAGADPGPVCYGRGGVEPTVTDANLVLGRIPRDGFQGGSMSLDREAALKAIGAAGRPLGLSPYEAAMGIIRVANAVMERALRKISVEQGYDPRSYTLVPFGGAGSLHACELAEVLGMERILIPLYPGVLSAWGLTIAENSFDASAALLEYAEELVEKPGQLDAVYQDLEKKVNEGLSGKDGAMSVQAWFDMRYSGQSFELEIPVELPLSSAHIKDAIHRFHEGHDRRFGYQLDDSPVEMVALRVQGSQRGAPFEQVAPALPRQAQSKDSVEERDVWFSKDAPTAVRYLDRARLMAGQSFDGPVIVGQYDATLLVFPSWRVSVDVHRNILLRRK